ncbi:glycosyltransferase family 2 protein [Streptomyces sp. NPDC059785]|uniref:glycosyltransferase family 2 protein n=1 Tax=unclassified Streptomyces TaxID=2593676 RepID=UPI00364C111D
MSGRDEAIPGDARDAVPDDTHGGAYAVVVPTLGRPSLRACLRALALAGDPRPVRVVLVDDRPDPGGPPLTAAVPASLSDITTVVRGAAAGPAAARNTGWRAAGPVEWIVFLDDDVVPGPAWARDLALDLAAATRRTAAVTARIVVPLPAHRPPTDWERSTAGLATARWITADMAYRRAALEAVGGFDERFRRAFREDADLALRVLGAGWTVSAGDRTTTHPVRPAGRWVSLRSQVGNADDVLMTRIHGRDWWLRARAPRGRLPRHLAVTTAAAAALTGAALGRHRFAAACAAAWLAGTAEFALARIVPGPWTRDETAAMTLTSVLIPPAASWHWLRGQLAHRGTAPFRPAGAGESALPPRRPAEERVRP